MRRLQQGDILLSSKLERVVSSSQEAVELIINLRNKKIQMHIMELGGDITSKAFSANFEKIARLF